MSARSNDFVESPRVRSRVVLFLNSPLPLWINETTPRSRALLPPKETPSAGPLGIHAVTLPHHATNAEEYRCEKKRGNSSPHEAEVIFAQTSSAASRAKSVAAFDKCGAVGILARSTLRIFFGIDVRHEGGGQGLEEERDRAHCAGEETANAAAEREEAQEQGAHGKEEADEHESEHEACH